MLSSRPGAPASARRRGDLRGASGVLERLDSPVAVAFVAAVAGTVFVLLRLAVVAKGDVTRFVVAGRAFVAPALAPGGLHVFPGAGYDGQFYYRLALDPADLAHTAFGITIDSDFRIQRIGLPVLAWLGSAGQHSLVPDALVAVNLAALTVLAFLGGVIARDSGRHSAWGLLLAGYWGFVFSIARDLPEVVASCFLVGGLLALRRSRPVAAGALFALSVLTMETTLDVVLAVAFICIFEVVRRRRRPGRRDAAWIMPGVAFVGWQAVGWATTGVLPMRSDAGDNLGPPFVNMIGSTAYYLVRLSSASALVWLGELFVLAVVTLFAAWAIRRSQVPAWEKAAWVIAVLVAVSLAHGLWYGKANFRAFEDLYLLSSIVLLGSRHRLWLPAALVAIAWAVTFVHYVVAQ